MATLSGSNRPKKINYRRKRIKTGTLAGKCMQRVPNSRAVKPGMKRKVLG